MLLGAAVVLVPLFLFLGRSWQNDVRKLMGMDGLAPWENLAILLVTVLMAALLLVLSRFVRGFARVVARLIDRVLPRRASVTIGVVLTVVLVRRRDPGVHPRPGARGTQLDVLGREQGNRSRHGPAQESRAQRQPGIARRVGHAWE